MREIFSLPRAERVAHIDLSTPCILNRHGDHYRKAVREYWGLDRVPKGWECCHLCSSGRRKGNCSNPLHIYLGTRSENRLDIPEEQRRWNPSQARRREGYKPKSVRHLQRQPEYRQQRQEQFFPGFKYPKTLYAKVVRLRKAGYTIRAISQQEDIPMSASAIKNFLRSKYAQKLT